MGEEDPGEDKTMQNEDDYEDRRINLSGADAGFDDENHIDESRPEINL